MENVVDSSKTLQSQISSTSCKEKFDLSMNLLEPYTKQIAGHGSESGRNDRTFLKHKNGRLLKPFQAPPKGTRETNFYVNLYSSKDQSDIELRNWIPKYFGIITIDHSNGINAFDDYIMLEDITEGYNLPNIMDIKIGSRTWSPGASLDKQMDEDAKYKGTKMPLGFSVLGIIVHPIVGDVNTMTKYDKTLGKEIKTDQVSLVPKIFFDIENSGKIPQLIEIIIQQLKQLQKVMENQRKYHIYASSVLFAYDAKAVREFLKDNDTKKLENFVRVKLIDFAHVFPSNGERDDNFLRGLNNLIKIFQDVLID